MKKIILLVFSLVLIGGSTQAQTLKVPAPSPGQTIKQDFGLSTIEVSYSRPSMKGRTIFGDLLPYDQFWRTGANSATTITFGDTVTIDGKKVAPGKYGLLSFPGQTEWIVIISKSTNTNAAADYKMEDDLLRVKVKPQTLSEKVETFTIELGNMKPASCELQLIWDRTMVSLPISTDIDSRIMSDIDKMVVKDSRPYFQAANYYQENGKDLNKALEWYTKAAEAYPKAYWIMYQKANCLSKLNRKKEAMDASMQSMNLAKEDKNNDYIRLNEKLQKSLQ
jgi:hypothetical protein